jgi:hypothetical protein
MDKILLVFVLCLRMKLIRRRALARGAAVLLLCCCCAAQLVCKGCRWSVGDGARRDAHWLWRLLKV